MFLLWLLLTVVLGFIAGYVVAFTIKSTRNLIGTLRVDNSIPEEGAQLYLELEKGVPEIKNHDYVTLRVSTKNYVSQK